MESVRYLNRTRKLTDTGSDYAVARLLGISEDAVNSYRLGRRVMNDYACVQIADALKIDSAIVIAAANYDREKDPTKKRKWATIMGKVRAAGRDWSDHRRKKYVRTDMSAGD